MTVLWKWGFERSLTPYGLSHGCQVIGFEGYPGHRGLGGDVREQVKTPQSLLFLPRSSFPWINASWLLQASAWISFINFWKSWLWPFLPVLLLWRRFSETFLHHSNWYQYIYIWPLTLTHSLPGLAGQAEGGRGSPSHQSFFFFFLSHFGEFLLLYLQFH